MHVSVWGEICATRQLNLSDVFCCILVVGGTYSWNFKNYICTVFMLKKILVLKLFQLYSQGMIWFKYLGQAIIFDISGQSHLQCQMIKIYQLKFYLFFFFFILRSNFSIPMNFSHKRTWVYHISMKTSNFILAAGRIFMINSCIPHLLHSLHLDLLSIKFKSDIHCGLSWQQCVAVLFELVLWRLWAVSLIIA